jgi:N-acetylmuramoyl-L-alanine amidase
VMGFNATTLGVSYVGGIDRAGAAKDTRTNAQKAAILALVRKLAIRYPKAKILGHRDLSPDKNHNGIIEPSEWIKQCPCFSARSWARDNGLPAAPGEPGIKVAVVSDAEAFPAGTFVDMPAMAVA